MKRTAATSLVPLLVLALALPAGAGEITGTYQSKRKRDQKDAVVHIEKAPGEFPPPAEHAVMDQKDLVFIPRVLPVVAGTTVDFLNSDPVRHNVFSPDGEKYNLGTWPQGEVKSYTFENEGVYVQLCNVHPEMAAYVVVLQNPYFAVTDEDGAYTIRDVPAGEYTLKIWHEKLKKPKTKKVTVPATGTVAVEF